MRLGATIDVEHSHVRFLGNLVLNLWDCGKYYLKKNLKKKILNVFFLFPSSTGGQEAFMENYFDSQRDHIFTSVELLIYVIDVESREGAKDLHYYEASVDALRQNSPQARVFVLVHKMDLVPEANRDQVFADKEAELRRLAGPHMPVTCFRTSIWDETLYKAWSSVVYSLVPNVAILERQLTNLSAVLEAQEIVLFERATFLVISHVSSSAVRDHHRHEKVSNIVKGFKMSCSKSHAQFQSMRVKNSSFEAFLDSFSTNTYILVVTADKSIEPAATQLNINLAKAHFERLISGSTSGNVF
jgi:Ras-related GTP-binding protein A/B